jgi:hypothetical protein
VISICYLVLVTGAGQRTSSFFTQPCSVQAPARGFAPPNLRLPYFAMAKSESQNRILTYGQEKSSNHSAEAFFLVAGAGQRTFLALPKTLFRSGMLEASFCACPHSTEPGLRPTVRACLSTKIKCPPFGEHLILVAGAGLEPATSWL